MESQCGFEDHKSRDCDQVLYQGVTNCIGIRKIWQYTLEASKCLIRYITFEMNSPKRRNDFLTRKCIYQGILREYVYVLTYHFCASNHIFLSSFIQFSSRIFLRKRFRCKIYNFHKFNTPPNLICITGGYSHT